MLLKTFDFIQIFVQTLTTLNLHGNKIGAEGAQHLAQALQNNTVRQVLFRSAVYSLLYFDTDAHHARS
jgi:Ran GTPase-activating protein (RanGAP) involved in mRNA processing and transport